MTAVLAQGKTDCDFLQCWKVEQAVGHSHILWPELLLQQDMCTPLSSINPGQKLQNKSSKVTVCTLNVVHDLIPGGSVQTHGLLNTCWYA